MDCGAPEGTRMTAVVMEARKRLRTGGTGATAVVHVLEAI